LSGTFDYIESYFTGRCSESEKQQFEDRCAGDQAFAEEVAFYIQSRDVLKKELLAQKRAAWSAAGRNATEPRTGKAAGKVRTLYLAAAAIAAVLLLFTFYLLTRPKGPSQLAVTYIHTHYDQLSQTLDGSRDSLSQAVTAYNNGSFTEALEFLTPLTHSQPPNTDALLYSGLAWLRIHDYDHALEQFDALANIPALYSNPGPFLKAVTLLQRNATGDRETARRLLQEVVHRQLDGSREAAAWLQKF
jgi:hypothetical protein